MDTTGKIYIALSAVALVGMITLFWVISKKCPKGVLLGVGAGLWVLGQAISSAPVRELKLVGGVCVLSGFIGGLLGSFDLFRKPKKSVPPQPPSHASAEPPPLPPRIK